MTDIFHKQKFLLAVPCCEKAKRDGKNCIPIWYYLCIVVNSIVRDR